ncbi:unnamed protein product [Lampetra planeri]
MGPAPPHKTGERRRQERGTRPGDEAREGYDRRYCRPGDLQAHRQCQVGSACEHITHARFIFVLKLTDVSGEYNETPRSDSSVTTVAAAVAAAAAGDNQELSAEAARPTRRLFLLHRRRRRHHHAERPPP